MVKITAEAAKKAELKERYLAYLAAETWRDDEKMMDYERKKISQVVELDNGELVAIEKPKIETRFCFGYSHYDDSEERAEKMADYASTKPDYFINENLREFDRIPERLRNRSEEAYTRNLYNGSPKDSKVKFVDFWKSWDIADLDDERKSAFRKLSPAEIEKLLTAYAEERAIFEKRLHAYLKRYGTEKLNCWTYWRDE